MACFWLLLVAHETDRMGRVTTHQTCKRHARARVPHAVRVHLTWHMQRRAWRRNRALAYACKQFAIAPNMA